MSNTDKIVFGAGNERQPIFFAQPDGHGYHAMIVGTSGKGKSALLQAEALRLGIPYDDLLKRLEPTHKQKEREKMRQQEKQQKEAQRLDDVREAFWNATPANHSDFDCLHDVLVVADLAESPTPAQVKALFMMLPANILGSAISWGFSDTEVRELIYEFVEQNRAAVAGHVTAAK